MFRLLLFYILIYLTGCLRTNYSGFKDKKYWTYYKEFENADHWKVYRNVWGAHNVSDSGFLTNFLKIYQFKNNEKVASIGAALGLNEILYAKFSPNLEFYLEDIDSSYLNRLIFEDICKKVNAVYPQESHSTFKLVIGDSKKTTLPNDYFDKIILERTLHELEFEDEMIADIGQKLKKNGSLFVSENLPSRFMQKCSKAKRPYRTEEQLVSFFARYQFVLVNKYDPSGVPEFIKCWEFKKNRKQLSNE